MDIGLIDVAPILLKSVKHTPIKEISEEIELLRKEIGSPAKRQPLTLSQQLAAALSPDPSCLALSGVNAIL